LTIKESTYKIPIEIDNLKFYRYNNTFTFENGATISELTIAYHTFGKLNTAKDNVIWVCHALTANSDVADWWEGLFGVGKIFDPNKYFIVCANILGSCYGSTCARSISPKTNKAYGLDFPKITIRDIVNAHELLRQHLEITSIDLCIGGSCGGHQVMEVTSAKETAWAIATHEAQRMAIKVDPTFSNNENFAGKNGLKAARGMALLGYRTFDSYIERQTNTDERTDNFSASSYIQYQGEKLQNRFYAQAYYCLTKTLDTHNIGRGRGGIQNALEQIKIPTFIFSISSDLLIPPSEQKILAGHIPNSTLVTLDSPFGHDGFLVESKKINVMILEWMKNIDDQ